MSSPRCPVCDVAVDPERTPTMPFCSDRCRYIDLGRWLEERYGLPYESESRGEAAEGEPDKSSE